MFKKLLIITGIILIIQFCHSPLNPITEGNLQYSEVYSFATNGYALDVDISDNLIALSANYDGTYLFDLNLNEENEVESIDERVHLIDWEANLGEEKSNKVVISESHDLVFILDMNDRIYLYNLNGEQYLTNYLTGCFGDNWRDFVIDDSQLDSIFIYPLLKHDSAEGAAEYDAGSTSIVNGIISFSELTGEFELECTYGVNKSYFGEFVSFSDSLIAFSEGELGLSIFKQNSNAKLNNEIWDEGEEYVDSNENGIYDSVEPFDDFNNNGVQDSAEDFVDSNENGTWDEGEDFYDCGEYDWQPGVIFCSIDNPVGNGVWDAEESYIDINGNEVWDSAEEFIDVVAPTAQFDLPGEILTIESFNNTVFTGHSYNKGCYMSSLDQDGRFVNNISFAEGHNIRGIDTDGDIIALSAGYDGVLVYEWIDNSTVKLLGNIETGYANSVRINNNNIFVATRDGLEIYKIER